MNKKTQSIDEDDPTIKVCPIMTAGNVSPAVGNLGHPSQYQVKCLGPDCGIWSVQCNRCGFITKM